STHHIEAKVSGKFLLSVFGAFTLNNPFSYTSSNTASSHNSDHRKCVDKLLYDLYPLSNSINQFLKKYYGNPYEKLSKLKSQRRDARDNRITLSQPKKSQTEIPERSCDKRRGNIDLSRARRGLKAEDSLPDG
ncbi:7124_t:CDS:2, partial [Paraglomus occultum]